MRITCPNCKSDKQVKSGFVRDKQRYKCKDCGCNFTLNDNRRKYDNKIRNLAVRMYLNNCGFRRISSVLEVPLSTCFLWIKNAGKIVDEMVKDKKERIDSIEILEMDELYTYVKKKPKKDPKTGKFSHPYTRIWTAVDRNRNETITFKIGDGDKSNFIELAHEIEEKCSNINYLCTDGYSAYASYSIARQHIVSKSETCLVEAKNSSLRDMLARLNRRTKRFSKCKEMLRLALVMFYNKKISYKIYL